MSDGGLEGKRRRPRQGYESLCSSADLDDEQERPERARRTWTNWAIVHGRGEECYGCAAPVHGVRLSRRFSHPRSRFSHPRSPMGFVSTRRGIEAAASAKGRVRCRMRRKSVLDGAAPHRRSLAGTPALGPCGRGDRLDLELGGDRDPVLAILVDLHYLYVDAVAGGEHHVIDVLDVLLRQLGDVAEAVDARPQLDKDTKRNHVLHLAPLKRVADADRRWRRRARAHDGDHAVCQHLLHHLDRGRDGGVAGRGDGDHRRVALVDVDVGHARLGDDGVDVDSAWPDDPADALGRHLKRLDPIHARR
mmetsp:Transcript_29568/g.95488  ORF Transcript_29568/g.95488 Transcript_29568/m.95488 type:complete len:305 (-) Transcript_29568:2186-3100(-)